MPHIVEDTQEKSNFYCRHRRKSSQQHQFADSNEIEHGYQQNLESFKAKENGLKKLMLKV